MKFEEKLNYNEELINEAALTYWKNTFASTFIISILGVVAALTLIYLLNFKSWISGSFLALSITSSIIFFLAFFIYRKRSLAIYKEMETPTAKCILNEKYLLIESDVGKSEIHWKMFKSIIKSKRFWLLVYKNNNYSVFPTDGVSNETLNFISKKVSEYGPNT